MTEEQVAKLFELKKKILRYVNAYEKEHKIGVPRHFIIRKNMVRARPLGGIEEIVESLVRDHFLIEVIDKETGGERYWIGTAEQEGQRENGI